MEKIQAELFEYANTLPIIDAHEHFLREDEHLNKYLSFYDYIAVYAKGDLIAAGADVSRLADPQNEKEAAELFKYIEPFWQDIKYGSYARPILLALKKFHNCDDFTAENIIKIGRELNKRNVPGHFDEIFDECRIEKILNQSLSGHKEYSDPRFCYCIYYDKNAEEFLTEFPNGTYDEFLVWLDGEMVKDLELGAKLNKFYTEEFLLPLDEAQARADFEEMKKGAKRTAALSTAISHYRIGLCGKHGIVAAFHTGVWGNINRLSPNILFPLAEKYGDRVAFDVYHMGMPFARECGFLGKNYANTYLNLCWSPCVSEHMYKTTLNEWLDYVPVNKIIGFGGDVFTLPEHVWAQLQHALECMTAVLAERINEGRMEPDYAKYILRLWLYENPKRVYKL